MVILTQHQKRSLITLILWLSPPDVTSYDKNEALPWCHQCPSILSLSPSTAEVTQNTLDINAK